MSTGTNRKAVTVMVVAIVLGVVALTATALLVASVLRDSGAATPTSDQSGAVVTTTGAVDAAAVLREWDEARAAAWAAGDEEALRELYVRGSAAEEQDVGMLRDWAGRGLRVEGMRMQVLAVEVLERTDRRLVLRVTDRLAGAVAVRDSDGEQWALPRDRADTHRLAFRRTAGSWRLASSYDNPVASSDLTSGSANS